MAVTAPFVVLSLLGEEQSVREAKSCNALDQLDALQRRLSSLLGSEAAAHVAELRDAFELMSSRAKALVFLHFSPATGGTGQDAPYMSCPWQLSPLTWADERVVERLLLLDPATEEATAGSGGGDAQDGLLAELEQFRRGERRGDRTRTPVEAAGIVVPEYQRWEGLLRAAVRSFTQAAQALEAKLKGMPAFRSVAAPLAAAAEAVVLSLRQRVFLALLTRLRLALGCGRQPQTSVRPLFSIQPFVVGEEGRAEVGERRIKVESNTLPSVRFHDRLEKLLKWEMGPQMGCDLNKLLGPSQHHCRDDGDGEDESAAFATLKAADHLLDDICANLTATWKATEEKVQLACRAYETAMNTMTDSLSAKRTALHEAQVDFFRCFLARYAPELSDEASLTNSAVVALSLSALRAHAVSLLSRDVERLLRGQARPETDGVSDKVMESLFFGSEWECDGGTSAADALGERLRQFQERYSTNHDAARFRKGDNSEKVVARLLDEQKTGESSANSEPIAAATSRASPAPFLPTKPMGRRVSGGGTDHGERKKSISNTMPAARTATAKASTPVSSPKSTATIASREQQHVHHQQQHQQQPMEKPSSPSVPMARVGRRTPKVEEPSAPPSLATAACEGEDSTPPLAVSRGEPREELRKVSRAGSGTEDPNRQLTQPKEDHSSHPLAESVSESTEPPTQAQRHSRTSLPMAKGGSEQQGKEEDGGGGTESSPFKVGTGNVQVPPLPSPTATATTAPSPSPQVADGKGTTGPSSSGTAPPSASFSLLEGRYPFLEKEPCPGVLLADLDLEADARFRAAIHRLVMRRNADTIAAGPRFIGDKRRISGHEAEKAIREQEAAVNAVVRSLSEELRAATFEAKRSFPFLPFRVKGVLLGHLWALLDQDDLFQSLLRVRSQVVRGASGAVDGNRRRLAGVERCLCDEADRIVHQSLAGRGLVAEDQIGTSLSALESAFLAARATASEVNDSNAENERSGSTILRQMAATAPAEGQLPPAPPQQQRLEGSPALPAVRCQSAGVARGLSRPPLSSSRSAINSSSFTEETALRATTSAGEGRRQGASETELCTQQPPSQQRQLRLSERNSRNSSPAEPYISGEPLQRQRQQPTSPVPAPSLTTASWTKSGGDGATVREARVGQTKQRRSEASLPNLTPPAPLPSNGSWLKGSNSPPVPQTQTSIPAFHVQRRTSGMAVAVAAGRHSTDTRLARPRLPVSPDASLNDVYLAACQALGMRPNSALIRTFPSLPGTYLERLDLSVNYIGAKGLQPVLYVLESNGNHLKSLSLCNNSLENMEALAVLEVLSREAGDNLSHLDLSHNPVSQTCGQTLLRFAMSRPNLISVKLEGTLIPPTLMQMILDRVDNNNNNCRKHNGLA